MNRDPDAIRRAAERQRESNQRWQQRTQATSRETAKNKPKCAGAPKDTRKPRKALKNDSSGPSVKPRKRIKPVSAKETQRKIKYHAAAAVYLAENPECHCCIERGKARPNAATQVHHIVGRDGDNLCDRSLWMAVCDECHTTGPDAIHARPAAAYEKGWLISRFWKRAAQIAETKRLRGGWAHVKVEIEGD